MGPYIPSHKPIPGKSRKTEPNDQATKYQRFGREYLPKSLIKNGNQLNPIKKIDSQNSHQIYSKTSSEIETGPNKPDSINGESFE